MDPIEFVRTSLAAGETPDDIAHALIWDHKPAPIPAIKSIRAGSDMTLGEAKEVVHRNLPIDQQEASERTWDQLIDHAGELADEDG